MGHDLQHRALGGDGLEAADAAADLDRRAAADLVREVAAGAEDDGEDEHRSCPESGPRAHRDSLARWGPPSRAW